MFCCWEIRQQQAPFTHRGRCMFNRQQRAIFQPMAGTSTPRCILKLITRGFQTAMFTRHKPFRPHQRQHQHLRRLQFQNHQQPLRRTVTPTPTASHTGLAVILIQYRVPPPILFVPLKTRQSSVSSTWKNPVQLAASYEEIFVPPRSTMLLSGCKGPPGNLPIKFQSMRV